MQRFLLHEQKERAARHFWAVRGPERPFGASGQWQGRRMRQALRPRPQRPAGELGHREEAIACDFRKAC